MEAVTLNGQEQHWPRLSVELDYTDAIAKEDREQAFLDLREYSSEGSSEKRFRDTLVGVGNDEEQMLNLTSEDDRVNLDDLKEEGITMCVGAASCLIVPVTFFREEDKVSPARLARLMTRRTITRANGVCSPVWEFTRQLPVETNEFASHFRRMSGISGQTGATQRLSVCTEVMHELFPLPRFHAVTSSGHILSRAVLWKEITLLIVPHAALLCIKVDWMERFPGEDASIPISFSLQDLRMMVYLLKFPNLRPGVTRGWTFNKPQKEIVSDTLKHELGVDVFRARYEGVPICTTMLCNWLVKMEDEGDPPCRVELFSHLKDHTAAQIEGHFDYEKKRMLLFQIAHSEGSKYKSDGQDAKGNKTAILRPSSNRCILACADGVLAIEWSGSHELKRLALGVYLFLSLHVLAEVEVLVKLSFLSALGAEKLGEGQDGIMTLHEKALIRSSLVQLCTSLVKYGLTMCSDQCGGRKMYRVYFLQLRSLLQVDQLREELREGLIDTMQLVENDYREQTRVTKARERDLELEEQHVKQAKEVALQRRQDILDLVITMFGAIILPFSMISGIFGMNNSDTPIGASWGWVIGGTGIVCAALVLVAGLLFYFCRPRVEEYDARLLELRQLHANTETTTAYTAKNGGMWWTARGAAQFGFYRSENAGKFSSSGIVSNRVLDHVDKRVHLGGGGAGSSGLRKTQIGSALRKTQVVQSTPHLRTTDVDEYMDDLQVVEDDEDHYDTSNEML